MSKRLWKVSPGLTVVARQLEQDEYFDNKLASKGNYIIKIKDQEYYIPKDLFETIFIKSYSCLQDFIDENRDKYDDTTLDVLSACFERDN